MKTAEILINALQYIKQYKGQIFVIKVGGEAIPDKTVIDSVAKDLIFLQTVGIHPIIVHGSGKHISEAMVNVGKKPKFIGGLRVTNSTAIKIVGEELAKVNKQIVDIIGKQGGKSSGLSGKIVFNAKTISEELGYVGKVTSVNTSQIKNMLKKGIIPIIYPLGSSTTGETLNINADTAASELAVKLKASKFIIITNVMGVLSGKGKLINRLDTSEAKKLIKNGTISGGMMPKLTACISALTQKVGKAHIVKATKHAILEEILTVDGTGTMITR